MPLTDDKKADILMKGYDTLRVEILDRMKTAFSHLGYAGALIAFAIPLGKDATLGYWLAGACGFVVLLWISWVNWSWLRNCAAHLRRIESQMDDFYPGLLSWETRSAKLATRILLPPKSYEEEFGKTLGVDLPECQKRVPTPDASQGSGAVRTYLALICMLILITLSMLFMLPGPASSNDKPRNADTRATITLDLALTSSGTAATTTKRPSNETRAPEAEKHQTGAGQRQGAPVEDAERLKLLMEYTRFHIGLYITLFGVVISFMKYKRPELNRWDIFLVFGVICFFLAGACGGIIGSHIPDATSFRDMERPFGPFDAWTWGERSFLLKPYADWATWEHLFFWIGAIAIGSRLVCMILTPVLQRAPASRKGTVL
jgi:hypothetical protein